MLTMLIVFSVIHAENDHTDRDSSGQHSVAEPIVSLLEGGKVDIDTFISLTRHQIQHYTGQLAKDSSKQLKELNNYPPEEALDPR